MLMAALKMKAADYVARPRHKRDAEGRALVVHNGRSKGRQADLGRGDGGAEGAAFNDRRHDEQGQRQHFSSRILAPYMRRSPKVAEVLPIFYLRALEPLSRRSGPPHFWNRPWRNSRRRSRMRSKVGSDEQPNY
jgi:putative transposase